MNNKTWIKSSFTAKNLALSGLFIALGILMPFLTFNNRELASVLSLMHIPVLMCGLVCGGPCGLLVGLITPLLRSFTVGMPVLFPTACSMALELACYGLLSAVLRRAFKQNLFGLYAALIIAMIAGRFVSFGATMLFAGLAGKAFSASACLTTLFVTALPGIALHIVIIPPLVLMLNKLLKRRV